MWRRLSEGNLTNRCTSTEITFTVTSDDPWVGSFEGDVTCADQPDKAESVDGTISGEIRG
jgi:hypothetical protein